jgi:hypothetical protein
MDKKIEWVIGVPYLVLNEGGTLVINYEKWMDLTKDQKKFVLQHEQLHDEMFNAHMEKTNG